MKTVKEWFKTLPQPYRKQALDNTSDYKGYGYSGSRIIALMIAFDWRKTKEGEEYWERVFNMCKTGNFVVHSMKKRKKREINLVQQSKLNVDNARIKEEQQIFKKNTLSRFSLSGRISSSN